MVETLIIAFALLILALTIASGFITLFEEPEHHMFIQGEQVLCRIKRHWIVLVQRSIVPGLAAIIAFSIAFYRAVGGTLLQEGIENSGQIDIFNILILGVILAVALGWWFMRRTAHRNKKRLSFGTRFVFGLSLLLLAGVFTFRYDGGRIFYLDPLNAVGVDLFNAILIAIGIVMIATIIYSYYDWRDDQLTLTTSRVIFIEQEEIPVLGELLSFLLQRRVVINEFIQQMVLDDIQQVNVDQDTYLAYWLHRLFKRFGFQYYATIKIQSFSPQQIIFESGVNPKIMQDRILEKVNALRKDTAPEAVLRRLIEAEVYKKNIGHKSGHSLHSGPPQQSAGPLSFLFPPNPEYKNDKNKTIIWRPAWPFVLWVMIRPILVALAISIAALYVYNYDILEGRWAFALWLPLFASQLFWIWWIYEDYRYDTYELTTESIVDVDKRPFGPINRRQAGLGSIQNVTFDSDFIESIIRIGRVDIVTGGPSGTKFTFHHVPSPYNVQEQINAYVLEYRRKQNERPLRDSIGLVRAYHNVQQAEGELLDRQKLTEEILERFNNEVANTAPALTEIDERITHEARREARATVRRELYEMMRRRARRRLRGNQ